MELLILIVYTNKPIGQNWVKLSLFGTTCIIFQENIYNDMRCVSCLAGFPLFFFFCYIVHTGPRNFEFCKIILSPSENYVVLKL